LWFDALAEKWNAGEKPCGLVLRWRCLSIPAAGELLNALGEFIKPPFIQAIGWELHARS
jgi:hypothetical protein